MSKRLKISFSEINRGCITMIDAKNVYATNCRVKEEMIPIVKKYERTEAKSKTNASLLVLNA